MVKQENVRIRTEISFGRYLRNERLNRGVKLQEVALATRISDEMLLAIENEDFSGFPGDAFMKGFVRSYAKCVGADAELALRLYEKNVESFRKSLQAEADLKKANAGYWRRLALSLAALAAVIAGTMYASRMFLREAPGIDEKPLTGEAGRSISLADAGGFEGEAVRVKEDKLIFLEKGFLQPPNAIPVLTASAVPVTGADPGSDRTPAPEISELSAAPSVDRSLSAALAHVLEVETVEETWLKVIIDIQEPAEYLLKPGDRLELEAASGFNLLVGNAGGVRLKVNGKPLSVPGKHGQVVNLQIP